MARAKGGGWLWLALGGGALWIAGRSFLRGASMTSAIADYLRGRLSGPARGWANEIAAGVADTMPSDFTDPAAPGDADAAARRWALDVAALAQHETGYGTFRGYAPVGDPTGWGDRGNAFGFWQFDKHFFWNFIQSSEAQTVRGQACEAAGKLATNWNAFAGDVPDASEREALAVATYNASLSRVLGMVANGATVAQVDATTTQRYGKGYAENVLGIAQDWAT